MNTPGGDSAGYAVLVVTPAESASTPALDEWIATEGQDHVLTAVENLRDAVADGAVPELRDDASLRAYWDRRRRQTA
jgi:hypothetical protein